MARKANIAASVGIDGEKQFRQAITNINSDMKVLSSEMKKVTSAFGANEKSIESLTAKEKVLNAQVEKQKEKVEELRKAMENSKNQYPDNEKKLNEWKTSLNLAEAKLNGLNREVEENKKAMNAAQNPTEELSKDVKKFGSEANTAGKHSLKMGDIIKANLISGAIISGVKALASALVGVTKQAVDMIEGTIDLTGEIADNSKKVGMSAEEYQKWKYTAKQAGLEQDTLNTMMEKQQVQFTKAIAGSKEQSKAYRDLGVDIKGLTSSGAFEKVIKALADMKDENEQNRIANILFGKSFADIKPLLDEGAAGIETLRQRAVDLGGVMSNESVAAGEKLGDTIDDLKFMFSGVANEIIVSFMPELQKFADWVLANKEEIKKFGTGVIDKIADGFQWFADHRTNIEDAFGGILNGLKSFSDNKEVIVGAVSAIAGAFIGAAIAAGAFHSAWSIGVSAVAIVAGIWAISDAIDAVTGKASKRPNVTSPTGTAPGASKSGNSSYTGTAPGAQSTKSTGSATASAGYSRYQRHAKGAIFTRPTLFNTPTGYHEVAEAGMEGVLPIKKLPSLLGMDNLADQIGTVLDKKLRGMVVMLDGEVVGSFVDGRLVKAVG